MTKTHLGGLITENYPNPCEDCGSEKFYLWKEGEYYICFCENKECIYLDMEITKEIRKKEKEKEKERNRYGQIQTASEKFRMGSLFKHASLSRLNLSPETHKNLSKWVQSKSKFLTIMGNPGTGKTYICAAVLNFLIENKQECFYITQRRMMSYIQQGIAENKHQYTLVDELAAYPVLIIDDIGSSTNTEWQKDMLLELLDQRYSDNRKTLITTNLCKADLETIFGKRICSRIFDASNSTLEFWGKDKRELPEEERI